MVTSCSSFSSILLLLPQKSLIFLYASSCSDPYQFRDARLLCADSPPNFLGAVADAAMPRPAVPHGRVKWNDLNS
uniref:Secreted protein n=1 Tax=Setaria viridis TaxID=4556 RepID=A0A4U6TN89_SETVI|nr:hypothetical protein SEVIR_7G016405v2 [Setaria viridis]